MPEHVLEGCRPVPLAHYLKAIGVLRLVAEQKDYLARGCWQRECFVLRTTLERAAVERFFLEEYRPTPLVSPWNGGSGFYPKDNRKALEALEASTATRFADLRETIGRAKVVLQELGITDKAGGDAKATLLERCRATFPDHSLQWLDAAYVLSAEGPKYPPLLGTGGNDGRLDFTNNYMQRLLSLFDQGTGEPLPGAKDLLRAALFDSTTNELLKGAPIGQFLPHHAGGANADTGFDAESLINPWDFVLMLEGAAAFATATSRRAEQETSGAPSYPFTVRTVGVGYASGADEDEKSSRAEIWLPLWSRPATARETLALLAEGRARVGQRTAENGLDFVRAVAGLGVDRGINAFQRFGFQVRNGLAYFAVPMGRFMVKSEPRVALLGEIDYWLETFRWKANSQTAPASAARALRDLEAAIFELCTHGDHLRLQQVLIALGHAEQMMATSIRWTKESYIQPVPALSADWLQQTDDGSTEFRLASSLASIVGYYGSSDAKGTFLPVRRQFEPVQTWKTDTGIQVRWDFDATRDVAWTASHLTDALNAVLQRRLVLAVRAGASAYPDRGRLPASLGDIADFIEGRVDEQRMADLIWGCLLVDRSRVKVGHRPARRSDAKSPFPPAFYSLLKLCFAGPGRVGSDHLSETSDGDQGAKDVPIVPQIHRLAATGRGAEASREAIRRLRGTGISPAVSPFELSGAIASRSAAALLFPISHQDRKLLARVVGRPEESESATQPATTTTPSGAIA